MLQRLTKILLITVMVCASQWLNAQTTDDILRQADSIVDAAHGVHDTAQLASMYNQAAYKYLAAEQYEKSITYAEKSLTNARLKDLKNLIYEDDLLLARTNYKINETEVALYYYIAAKSVLDKKTKEGAIAIADIDTEMGLLYFGRRHYSRAADFFSQALDTYKKENEPEKIKQNTNHLAVCTYLTGNYEGAASYYRDLLSFSQRDGDHEAEKQYMKRLADIYQKIKQYDKALDVNYSLYDMCAEDGDTPSAVNALNNIAYCQTMSGKPMDAVKIFKQISDLDINGNVSDDLLAGTYSNIGLCYQNLGNTKECYVYLDKAADLRLKNNQLAEYSQICNIMALLYLKDRDLHNATIYCNEAVKAAESTNDPQLKLDAYQTLNQLLQAKGEYDEALGVYQKYLSIRDSVQLQQTINNRELAEDLDKLDETSQHYSEEIVENELNELTHKQLELLAEQRKQENELLQKDIENRRLRQEAAEQDLRLAKQQTEALLRQSEIDKLRAEQADSARKLAEQRTKEMENARAISDLENEKQRQALELQNEKNEKQKLISIVALFGVMLGVFVVFFIIVHKKNNLLKAQKEEIVSKNADLMHKNEEILIQKENLQMANDEIMNINEALSQQKGIIEAKNKSITDSIVYAQRIQQAVCPLPDFLEDYNIEYFLFYRPKEIVSGDYYWFYHEGDTIFAVAADCTGHGVPGAFMSMLGVSLFNKIVSERRIFDPAQILNDMRDEVKKALHQDSIYAKNKDGMDLSLVKIDTANMTVEFAGANNNGYIVTHYSKDEEDLARQNLEKKEQLKETPDGFLRLQILPADRMPIGVYLGDDRRFTSKTARLRHGDAIYLTSDGYIDQFGGSDGRKFLFVNFYQLLLDINSLPMQKQCDTVKETHEKWIGDQYRQLDDIIVMGLKIL